MKAVRFHGHGGPEVLVHEDVDAPRPGPGEVLVRVEAAGVNFADAMRRNGDPYPEASVLPFTLGVEVAGTVEALGEGIAEPAVGTPVFAAPGRGGYAQFAVVPAAQAIPIPPGLDAVRASALILQGLTAALALREVGRLGAGEGVLVQAAAGGVGLLAVQLAKLYGAGTVVAAASTPEKRRLALDHGADAAVDYTGEAWPDEVRAATDGRGVDVVLDMVGGRTTERSLAALAPLGRLVVYGNAGRGRAAIDPQALIADNQSVVGFYVGGYFARPELIRATLGELIGHVASGALRLRVDHVLPLARAADAHRLLEGRRTTGKVVLLPWADAAEDGGI